MGAKVIKFIKSEVRIVKRGESGEKRQAQEAAQKVDAPHNREDPKLGPTSGVDDGTSSNDHQGSADEMQEPESAEHM